MSLPRVYADFHHLDDANRLRLTCAGTVADLSRLGLELHEGLPLTFYMDDADDQGRADDLLVEGVVQYDPVGGEWVALADWGSVRHASEEGGNGAVPGGRAVPAGGLP